MGVPGLWKMLSPALQSRSLAQVTAVEGYECNRRGLHTMIIGVDASIWMMKAQKVFHKPSHTQCGKNPELRALFYRLCYLARFQLSAVFIFDGASRPSSKRSKHVRSKPHWLTEDFKKFISMFGFHYYVAPGEAEAELALLNGTNLIDAVMTDDGDTFIFGATCVIKNPDIKKDGDSVIVGTAMSIQSNKDTRLTRGGMLLIALLCGGDYDETGLNHCGEATAFNAAHLQLGDELLHAAQNLSSAALSIFLVTWRAQLQEELLTNKSQVLSSRAIAAANAIVEDFPDINVVLQYAKPVTSLLHPESRPDPSTWVPQLPRLAELASLCHNTFSWDAAGIMRSFRSKVWPVCCIQRLSQTSPIVSVDMTQHVMQDVIGDTPPFLASFLKITKVQLHLASLKLYSVQVAIRDLAATTRSGLHGQPSSPPCAEHIPKLSVLIPDPVLSRAFPALIQQFKGYNFVAGEAPDPVLPPLCDSKPPKRKVVIDLTENSDDESALLHKKKHIADGDEVLDLTKD